MSARQAKNGPSQMRRPANPKLPSWRLLSLTLTNPHDAISSETILNYVIEKCHIKPLP